MEFIIDFYPETTNEQKESFFSDNNCQVVKTYGFLVNLVKVSSDAVPVQNSYVSRIVENTDLEIKCSLETKEFEPNDDKNWWKIVMISNTAFSSYPIAVRGVDFPIYLFDSGINKDYEEFSDRSIRNLYSVNDQFDDVLGHGTTMASAMVGKVSGIANSPIINVKIVDPSKTTKVGDLIEALDLCALDYVQNYQTSNRPALVNCSWTIDKNPFIESKIEQLTSLGLLFVVAAGNDGVDLSSKTPASMSSVITVGSFGPDLYPSEFSKYVNDGGIIALEPKDTNYGPGIDIWGPGESIWALGSDGVYGTAAGTSVATAVVSSLIAYWFSFLNFKFDKFALKRSTPEEYILLANLNEKISIPQLKDQTKMIMKKRMILQYSEKYDKDSFDIVFVIGSQIPVDEISNYEDINLEKLFVVEKGQPCCFWAFDKDRFNTVSISGLPAELSLDDNFLVGTLNTEISGDRCYEVLVGSMTVEDSQGSATNEIKVLYYDRNKFSDLDPEAMIKENDYLLADSNVISIALSQFVSQK